MRCNAAETPPRLRRQNGPAQERQFGEGMVMRMNAVDRNDAGADDPTPEGAC